MKEKDFQDMVIELFEGQDAHVVNMEPGTTNPGIPDLNFCLHGIEGNVELKLAYEEGAAPHIRPMQLVWFRERVKAKGYPMLAYFVLSEKFTDEVLIFQGRRIDELALCKDTSDVYDVEHLTVVNPMEMVHGLLSEIGSWHDEINPEARIQLIN